MLPLAAAVAVSVSCSWCNRAQTERASALVAQALVPATREQAAEALSCPPFVESLEIVRVLRHEEVAGCTPVGPIAAHNEGLFLEEGVWWAYINCISGELLFFSLQPVHGGRCGPRNAGFVLTAVSTARKDPRILFDVSREVKDKIERVEPR